MPPLELSFGDWNTDTQTSTNIAIDGDTFSLATVIPDSVVSQYRYEDDSNTSVAVDSIGSNDMDILGATYTTDARCGSLALDHDGSNDRTTSQSTIDLAASGTSEECSAGAFVKPASLVDFSWPFSWAQDGNNWFGMQLRDDGSWRALLQVGGSTVFAEGGSASTGTYQHLAVAIDSAEVVLLIDGSEVASSSHSLDLSSWGAGNYGTGNRADDAGAVHDGPVDNVTFGDAKWAASDSQSLIDQC